MSQDISTRKASPSAPSAEKKALLDAFDTVLKSQAEERDRELEARRTRAASRPLLVVGALILLGIGSYLAILQPAWVFAPRPQTETVAVQEASLKIAMASAAQHVERFRQKNGHLPESLAEAGARGDVMSYSRLGASSFRLVGDNGAAHATFTADQSLADFLGNSYQIIARRSR
jgi:hypothetical protein